MSVSSSSNPITSVAPASSNPITSVQPQTYQAYPQSSGQLLNRLHLDLRGERFVVEREALMNLPESVLLCLFPNGLVLSRPGGGTGDEEHDIYGVEFDPDCFRFVLSFFKEAQDAFYGTPTSPGGILAAQASLLPAPTSPLSQHHDINNPHLSMSPNGNANNPLMTKQAIIVLREELEYFAIPPKGSDCKTDPSGSANKQMMDLKKEAGKGLLERKSIFTALQRNVYKENNVAEQHLIDMLCMSGFDRDDVWGHRAIEPSRCCISSIALVLLKTGINHPSPGSPAGSVPTIDNQQMATAQKLLLFWRKPARKCWWDGISIEIPMGDGVKEVKVWSRRVWTLELSLL